MEKDKKQDHILDFRKVHFNLFRGLLGRMPWDMAEKSPGKLVDNFLRAQKWSITSGKPNRGGRRPEWKSKRL